MEKNTTEVTDADFTDTIKTSEVPVLVDFWAPWCGPCRLIGPIVDELANEYAGKLKVVKVNTDESPAVAAQFNIRSIPTILFFKNGEVAETMVGAVPKAQLARKIDDVIAN